MNKNLNSEEFVGRYLDNELSEIDRLDFENKLLSDADLRNEYSFQKDLVNGIKEVRRMELKSRLSNIVIQTPLYQTIAFKAITAATITAGLGIGAYYLFSDNSETVLTKIDLNQNKIELTEEYSPIPEIPEAIAPVEKQKPDGKDKTKKKAIAPDEKPVVAKNKVEKEEPKILQPNVIQPDVVDITEEQSFESNDPDIGNQFNNLDNIKENAESNVAVSTVKDKKNKFHYKFFENKLYLLGSFNEMPYEIIELNSDKGRSYFLYYNDSYYKLNTDQVKPTPLIKIENDSLVNELKIIQINQSN